MIPPTASRLALFTSGRMVVQIVDANGDRPTDAIDGQMVYVRGGSLFLWNANSGSAGAWEAA